MEMETQKMIKLHQQEIQKINRDNEDAIKHIRNEVRNKENQEICAEHLRIIASLEKQISVSNNEIAKLTNTLNTKSQEVSATTNELLSIHQHYKSQAESLSSSLTLS
jgi:uncharacterized protein (DUF2267 family)